jgi:hypothetical protein
MDEDSTFRSDRRPDVFILSDGGARRRPAPIHDASRTLATDLPAMAAAAQRACLIVPSIARRLQLSRRNPTPALTRPDGNEESLARKTEAGGNRQPHGQAEGATACDLNSRR